MFSKDMPINVAFDRAYPAIAPVSTSLTRAVEVNWSSRVVQYNSMVIPAQKPTGEKVLCNAKTRLKGPLLTKRRKDSAADAWNITPRCSKMILASIEVAML